jgi:hypothetical protein
MSARKFWMNLASGWTLAAGILLLGSLTGLGQLRAQEITGSISGVVHDPSGAVLPNATVVATRVESQSPFSTTTNELGLYSFPTLPTGTYQLSVQASGFRKYVGTGITLHVNERLAVDVTLQVGAVTQQVEVRAQPYLVNTQSGEVGNLVNGDQMKELPLNGRNFIALTTLVPGTAPGSAGGLDTFDVGLLGGASLSINGNASNANLWLVNGVNNLDIGSNRTLLVFPLSMPSTNSPSSATTTARNSDLRRVASSTSSPNPEAKSFMAACLNSFAMTSWMPPTSS